MTCHLAQQPTAHSPQPTINSKVLPLVQKHLTKAKEYNSLNSLPTALQESGTENCDSGTVSYSLDLNENTGNGTFNMTFNNCREDWGVGDHDITNGSIKATFNSTNEELNIKMEFNNYEITEYLDNESYAYKLSGSYNFTIHGNFNIAKDSIDLDNLNYTANWDISGTEDDIPFAYKGNMICTDSGCKLATDIKSTDGKTYRVKDLTVTTNSWGDLKRVTATIYHPDFGFYEYTADIDWMCDFDETSPFVGEATITSGDNSFKYISTDCDEEPTFQFN